MTYTLLLLCFDEASRYVVALRRRRRSALRRFARFSSWTLMKRRPRRCSRITTER